jgi:hypothetical protein
MMESIGVTLSHEEDQLKKVRSASDVQNERAGSEGSASATEEHQISHQVQNERA